MRDTNENTINVAKGIFGFVFENRDKLDTNVFRTLTHDLGIIIREDEMAVPYTVGNQHVMEEFIDTGDLVFAGN